MPVTNDVLRKHQLVEANPDMTFGQLTTRFMADAGPTAYHLGRLELLLPFFTERRVQQITKALVHECKSPWNGSLGSPIDFTLASFANSLNVLARADENTNARTIIFAMRVQLIRRSPAKCENARNAIVVERYAAAMPEVLLDTFGTVKHARTCFRHIHLRMNLIPQNLITIDKQFDQ
jgi:hypothetical protein